MALIRPFSKLNLILNWNFHKFFLAQTIKNQDPFYQLHDDKLELSKLLLLYFIKLRTYFCARVRLEIALLPGILYLSLIFDDNNFEYCSSVIFNKYPISFLVSRTINCINFFDTVLNYFGLNFSLCCLAHNYLQYKLLYILIHMFYSN